MPIATIKKEFGQKRVAFNNSAARLATREDIDDLAIIAQESRDSSLLRLFEYLPPLAILKKNRTDQRLRKIVLDARKEN